MKHLILSFFLLMCGLVSSQELANVQGSVLDVEVNDEPLPFVTVTVKGANISATTDLDGIYRLKLLPGNYTLEFNFPGYRKVVLQDVKISKNRPTHLKDVNLAAMQLSEADTSENRQFEKSGPKK